MLLFRMALSFLTIIPAGISGELDARAFGKSTKYFPVIGAVIGLAIAGLYVVIDPRLAGLAVDMVLVAALIAMTRAFHLDAVADTFDGLLGGRDKEHMLAIMKDSRVGSFGVVAIIAVIGLKVALLSSIGADMKLGALLAFPVLGRWAACYATVTQPSARSGGGLGASFIAGAGRPELLWSSIVTLAVIALAFRLAAIPVALVTFAFALVYIKMVRNKIGGMTGDTIGALIELTEVMVLFTLAVM